MKLRLAIILGLTLALGSAPGAAQSEGDETWDLVEHAQLGDGSIALTGIASLPGESLVMVGSGDRGRRALAWYSEDGRAWEAVKLPKSKNAGPTSVVGTDEGAIAVGNQQTNSGAEHGLVWTTVDGRNWSGPAKIKNAMFSDVVATPAGVSILGAAAKKNRREPTVWHSSDGTSWKPVRIAKADTRPREMAVTPDGMWTATAIDYDAQNYAVWRSSDGERWEAVADHPMIDPNTKRKVALSEIIATDAGIFAVVNWSDDGEDPTGSIWHSQTGADWTMVAGSDNTAGAAGVISGFPIVIMHPLVPSGADSDRTASVFSSVDGRDWTEAPVTGMDGATILLAPAPDGEVAVAGYALLEEASDDLGSYLASSDPAAWLGPSPPGWTAETGPSDE